MAAAVLWASALSLLAMEAVAADWPCSGRDIHNTRNADDEHVLDSSRIAELRPLWTVTTDGNVAATPAVMDGLVYATDFGGSLWAVDAATGQIIWKNAIGSYTGVSGDVSRTTPAHWQGALIMGDGAQAANTQEGAIVFALDAKSGRPKWRTKVEADPAAMITSAPIVDGGVVFVGTASKAETQDRPTTFRGSVLALSADTGKILWQTYLTKQGYTGVGVWGSTPAVDHDAGLVYVATGNNYSVPAGVCAAPERANCTPSPADNHVDSVIALDVKTGRIVWAARTLTDDVSTNFDHDGPDYDFRSGTQPLHDRSRRQADHPSWSWSEERRLLGAESGDGRGGVEDGGRSRHRPRWDDVGIRHRRQANLCVNQQRCAHADRDRVRDRGIANDHGRLLGGPRCRHWGRVVANA